MTSQRSMQKFCTRTIELGHAGGCARAVRGSELKSALAAAMVAIDAKAPASARIRPGSRSSAWCARQACDHSSRADRPRSECHRRRSDALVSLPPQVIRRYVEDDRGFHVRRQPGARPDLVLELHRSPARVACEPHHARRALPLSDGLEHLPRRTGCDAHPHLELPFDTVEAVLAAINQPDLFLRNRTA